jgi:transposase InsO family protein
VDSGNEWGCIITETLSEALGFPAPTLHAPAGPRYIGTAKEGAHLTILGRVPKLLHFIFSDAPGVGRFPLRPAVVKEACMDFNLSGPYMQHHGIDQIHSLQSLRVAGYSVPLHARPSALRRLPAPATGPTPAKRARNVYAASSITLPPFAMDEVDTRLGGAGPDDSGTLDTSPLESWDPALGGPEQQEWTGPARLPVVNDSAQTRHIRAGTRIAVLRIHHVGSVGDSYRPLTYAQLMERAQQPGTAEPGAEEGQPLEALREVLKGEHAAIQTKDQESQAFALLCDFRDVFSHDGSFGKTSLVKHFIHTDGCEPIKCRGRPVNPALLPSLEAQMLTWLRHDVIEPSTSPWSSALVPADKKNGKIRWCVDYRALNKVTKKDAYPMPLIEDNLAHLANSAIFTGLDGSGAFHVVELAEDAKEKTAFSTPWGLFQFKRMPFGLCNAPATYSRLMQVALHDIPTDNVLSYLDDTLVHTTNFAQHLGALRAVLQVHRRAGLRLQPSKCHFFKTKVEYLGHMVSRDGLQVTPNYTVVVKRWPLPRTLTELRAFLGKVGYYRRFIKDYGKIAAPLTEATKEENLKDKEKGGKALVPITPAYQLAHAKLRDALCSAPILAYPRFDQESTFIVDTDWSQENRAIGGVLSQRQDGVERVIAYGAKKLNSSQANYPATKGELFAVIYFLRHWDYYLRFKKFTLRTDHRALVWIRTMDAPSGMISRWLDILANFSFDVEYRKGTSHGNADALSRAPHAPDIEDDEDPLVSTLSTVFTTEEGETTVLPRTSTQWLEAQEGDPDLRDTVALLRRREVPPPKERKHLSPRVRYLLDLLPLLYLEEGSGLLRLRRKQDVRGVPVAPAHLERAFAVAAHELAAHRGVRATGHLLHLHVFLPSGNSIIDTVVRQCLACQTKGGEEKPQRHTYRTVVSGFPFQRLSIDFVGPLKKTSRGNTVILTVKDTFTKWVEAFALPRATAESVATTLTNEIFARFGYPDEIHSDRGSQFTSHLITQLAELIGVHITWTPAYHPQSNPVERAHRDLKAGLRAALETVGGDEWDTCLPQVLFAFRTSPARGTGISPFHALFGRHPNVPLGILEAPPRMGRPLADYVVDLQARMEAVHRWARENLVKEVHRQQRAYSSMPRSFEPGDRVWLYAPQTRVERGDRKLLRSWTGPWIVRRAYNGGVLYDIEDEVTRTCRGPVPLDRLKQYHGGATGETTGVTLPDDLLDLSLLPRRPVTPTSDDGEQDDQETEVVDGVLPPGEPRDDGNGGPDGNHGDTRASAEPQLGAGGPPADGATVDATAGPSFHTPGGTTYRPMGPSIRAGPSPGATPGWTTNAPTGTEGAGDAGGSVTDDQRGVGRQRYDPYRFADVSFSPADHDPPGRHLNHPPGDPAARGARTAEAGGRIPPAAAPRHRAASAPARPPSRRRGRPRVEDRSVYFPGAGQQGVVKRSQRYQAQEARKRLKNLFHDDLDQ